MKHVAQVIAVLSGLVVIFAFIGVGVRHAHDAGASPVIIPMPVPSDPSQPEQAKPRRKLLPLREPAPDGTEPIIDFPGELWFKNINSPRGGDGMCVGTSFEFVATYNGLYEFKGFRDWAANKEGGGGFPAKLARQVAEFCKARNIPPARFDPKKHLIQYEGADFGWVEACLKNGWPCGMTLFHSPRYGNGTIYHMTVCPHLDGQHGAIQDNNFRATEWCDRKEFERRVTGRDPNTGKLQFWAFAAVSPGPPPPPTNGS